MPVGSGLAGGVLAVRVADLVVADGADGTELLAPGAVGPVRDGDLVAWCTVVAVTPAVLDEDGRLGADGWLPDHVRLGGLEEYLGEGSWNRSANSCQAWADALDAFEGTDCVPLMTVHKSKGLEFDTMVMIGLDDKTWRSYAPDNPEGLATFFVAVSRAKQRFVITHCSQRGSRAQVAPLFDLLRRAGVPETDLTVPALSRR